MPSKLDVQERKRLSGIPAAFWFHTEDGVTEDGAEDGVRPALFAFLGTQVYLLANLDQLFEKFVAENYKK